MTPGKLFGARLPIIQAPMAGAQGVALAAAVSNAGGLGSLPCALLNADALRKELSAMKAQTDGPFNANFFCHAPAAPSAGSEARWRAALAPYLAEFGIDPASVPLGPRLAPFGREALEVLREVKPAVVSFHFGLPSEELLAEVRATGAAIMSTCRAALKSPDARHTAVTNVFSGRPARAIANRIVKEIGPVCDAAPVFPLALAAVSALRAKAEAGGSWAFTPVWCGQNAGGCREIPAAQLTMELAAGLGAD